MAEWTPSMIKALRSSLGLSQAKMGELLGVSDTYVLLLEKGLRNPGKSLCLLMDRIKAEKGQPVRGLSVRKSEGGKKS